VKLGRACPAGRTRAAQPVRERLPVRVCAGAQEASGRSSSPAWPASRSFSRAWSPQPRSGCTSWPSTCLRPALPICKVRRTPPSTCAAAQPCSACAAARQFCRIPCTDIQQASCASALALCLATSYNKLTAASIRCSMHTQPGCHPRAAARVCEPGAEQSTHSAARKLCAKGCPCASRPGARLPRAAHGAAVRGVRASWAAEPPAYQRALQRTRCRGSTGPPGPCVGDCSRRCLILF